MGQGAWGMGQGAGSMGQGAWGREHGEIRNEELRIKNWVTLRPHPPDGGSDPQTAGHETARPQDCRTSDTLTLRPPQNTDYIQIFIQTRDYHQFFTAAGDEKLSVLLSYLNGCFQTVSRKGGGSYDHTLRT